MRPPEEARKIWAKCKHTRRGTPNFGVRVETRTHTHTHTHTREAPPWVELAASTAGLKSSLTVSATVGSDSAASLADSMRGSYHETGLPREGN